MSSFLNDRIMKYPPLKSQSPSQKRIGLEDPIASCQPIEAILAGGERVKGHTIKTKWKHLSLALMRDSP